MERLYSLFEQRYGILPSSTIPLLGAASPRNYCRLSGESFSCVGVVGTDRAENEAFIRIARHFRSKGISVPEIYAVSDDGMAYIQEDLGSEMLFNRYSRARRRGESLEELEDLIVRTVALLPKMQFDGADGLDFSACHPQQEFTRRSAMFDLNYFKYCFLKPTGLKFDEVLLQDDFERLADDIADCGLPCESGKDVPTFLHRDCQARNVMLKNGEPYFIDFQGGMRGPIYYDVASFIWHPRSDYRESLKDRMLESYLDSLSLYIKVDRQEFMRNLKIFRLFRILQVLGAYGFRGWIEKKANFVSNIPNAVRSLSELLTMPFDRYPYLMELLKEMVTLSCFTPVGGQNGQLEVRVCSFSYKNGVPEDPTGNGGGYVFDCRSIHNPGRYEEYQKLTGCDEAVIRFLEGEGEVAKYLEHVYGVVDPHVESFMERGFTSLMVSFGCTGGQHRSVYCAEHLARHLAEKYPAATIRLSHREQKIADRTF